MEIYNYDPETKAFLRTSEADPDPIVHAQIAEREKRLFETRANSRAHQDALARGDAYEPPYPNAEDPNEIPPMTPEFLIPAHATAVAPPSPIPEGKIAVWLETAWALVDKPTPPVETEAGEQVDTTFYPDEYPDATKRAAAHQSWAMALLQAQLDAVARSLGYDDMKTMVGYADEPADPVFQAEGQAGRRWRSLFWRAAIEKLGRVQAGLEAPPYTLVDLMAGMPAYEPPAAPQEPEA